MINREIPFRPRLEGDFRVRFYDAASSITEHTPLSKIEHIQSDKKSVCENWRYQLKIFKLKQSIKTKQENLRIYQKPGSVLHRIGLLIYAAPFSSHGPELQMIS